MKISNLVSLFIVLMTAAIIGCGSNAPAGGDDVVPCDGGGSADTGNGTAPADSGPSDSGSPPTDNGVPADTGPAPADTGTDVGPAADTGPSPPFDGGLTSLVVWLDPAKHPGCSTVVWDNMGVEKVSEVEKPLVFATTEGWKGIAYSMPKCGGVYKVLSPVGADAQMAGYRQITYRGVVDLLKKSAVCSKPLGTADKLAIPLEGDLVCP